MCGGLLCTNVVCSDQCFRPRTLTTCAATACLSLAVGFPTARHSLRLALALAVVLVLCLMHCSFCILFFHLGASELLTNERQRIPRVPVLAWWNGIQ